MNQFLWIVATVLFVWFVVIIYKTWFVSRVSPNDGAPTFCPIPSYEIVVRDDHPTIKCLRCSMTSWHPKDVENLYCGNCHEFHITDIR